MVDVSKIIKEYAEVDIHIEMLADAYKIDGNVCYRGYVTYKRKGNWESEDMGCHYDWDKMFGIAVEFAKKILKMNQKEKLANALVGITDEILEENGITSMSIIQEVDLEKKGMKKLKPRLIVKTCGVESSTIDGDENIIKFIEDLKEL